MTTEKDDKMPDLEAYFEAARDAVPDPSDALMARIMADAVAVADGWAEPAEAPARNGFLRGFLDAVGGWPSVSGMVTAGFVGLFVGISPPALVSELTDSILYGTSDAYLVDPGDGFGFAF